MCTQRNLRVQRHLQPQGGRASFSALKAFMLSEPYFEVFYTKQDTKNIVKFLCVCVGGGGGAIVPPSGSATGVSQVRCLNYIMESAHFI